MDPLSATLSLISLATTLADILQLAMKLRESFQKISRNKEDAKRLASEIVTTLQQLKEFYSDHSDILDNSTSMKTAVSHLSSEMQAVYSKCCALSPVSGTKKGSHWQNARTVFTSWVNRSKVEEEIKELKTHVMMCYIQFTTFATARVEASTQRIYDISTRIEDTTTKIENRFLCLTRSQITKMITEQNFHLDVSNIERRNLNLLGAGLAGTLYRPRGEDVADAYLCSEIATIDQTLKALSRTLTFPTERADPYLKPFRSIIHFKPPPKTLDAHRRDVIMRTLSIFRTLHNDPTHGIVFQQAGWNLINLSIGLYQIQHYPEAITTGLWAVNLFRSMANADPNVYHPYLALSLHNVSHYHLAKGNKQEALDAMAECVEINRTLGNIESTPEILGLLVRSLVGSARLSAEIQDCQRSLQEIEEAIKISEDILLKLSRCRPNTTSVEKCSFTILVPDQEGVSKLDLWFPSAVFSDGEVTDVLVQTLQGYSQALHHLSYSLHHHGRFLEAIAADTKALQVLRWISVDAAAPLFENVIAEILYHLTHRDFRLFLPSSTSMAYIQESISIYRRASSNDSTLYSKLLYHALYTRATMLRSMGRYAEEVVAWKEMAELARSIQEDLLLASALYQLAWALRCLNQFKDAAASRMESVKAYRSVFKGPSQLEANALYELAADLELAGLSEQARISAQEAVDECRSLALKDHDLSTEALADSLALLADIYLGSLDVSRALETGKEALNIYRASISRNREPDVISKYMHCLDINMAAAFKSEDEEQAIGRASLVVELYDDLKICRTEEVLWGTIGTWESYGALFGKYDRLSEARFWVEKAVEWYATYPIADVHQTARFMIALCNYGAILDAQGLREQALNQTIKSIHLGKKFVLSGPSFASIYCICIVVQVDLLLDLGRYLEALEISESLVEYARQAKLPDIDVMVDSLLIHATALNYNQQHEQAIDIANEAIEISGTDSPTSEAQKHKDQVAQLAQAFYTLSESLADCGRECEALAYARKSVDHIRKLKSHPSHPVLEYKRILFTTNLSARLAASGDYQESVKLLVEVKTFYENHTPNRNGYFIELGRVLRLLGLLYCAWGKHDEGMAVSISFTNLRRRLLEVTPDLARHLDVYLKHEIRRPSWLRALQSKLDCSHQPDVCLYL